MNPLHRAGSVKAIVQSLNASAPSWNSNAMSAANNVPLSTAAAPAAGPAAATAPSSSFL